MTLGVPASELFWPDLIGPATAAFILGAGSFAAWLIAKASTRQLNRATGRAGLLIAAVVMGCSSLPLLTVAVLAAGPPREEGSMGWLSVAAASVTAALVIALAIVVRRLSRSSGALCVVHATDSDKQDEPDWREPAYRQGLAFALSTVDAGFITTDHRGAVVTINDVAARITGQTETSALGQSWLRVLGDLPGAEVDRTDPFRTMLDRQWLAEDGGKLSLMGADGQRLSVEVKAQLLYDDVHAVAGCVLVLRNLTRLMIAESQAARLAAIVDSSEDAIISKTLDGLITSWNRAAEGLFGYRSDEMVGTPILRLIPDERSHEERRIIASLAHGERVAAFDTERLTKDGRRIPVSIGISPIRDTAGAIVGASKIARDIMHQRDNQHTLEKSEARLQFILEAAGIGDWDFELATGAVNRSLRHDRCYGYDHPIIDWSFETFLQHVHPEDREATGAGFLSAIASQRDWRSEYRVIWPDGSVHWVRGEGSLLWQGGEPTHMLGIVTDFTANKEAESALLEMERLEAENRQILVASQLKSQFLANMSHELRTPLNAIIGFSDLLMSGAVPSDSANHTTFLSHISASGLHLLQLINDVLDLAKVESGKFEFFPEEIDLVAMISETREVLQTMITKKDLAVVVDVDASVGRVFLDPARLKQVLYNYLSNAIKFTPARGKITVRIAREGDAWFRLEVQDTGVGISETDQQRLFIEFQQLDSGYGKTQQGTGLGLSLTRKLVEAQGGVVGVHSTLGRGSAFYAVLNRHHDTAPASGIRLPPATAARAVHRCLVIEDEDHRVAEQLRALSSIGYAVDSASDRDQALQLARTTSYDAITVELVMKSQPGLDLLELVRREAVYPPAPVVGLSMSVDHRHAASFAVTNVLAKPIRMSEIRDLLATLRSRSPGRPTVMVIDDQSMALEVMRGMLTGLDADALCFDNGLEALDQLHRSRPDAIVLDLVMPGCDGFEILDRLQRSEAWRTIPAYVWTSMELTASEYDRLTHSAARVLSRGGGGLEPMLDSLRRRTALLPSIETLAPL